MTEKEREQKATAMVVEILQYLQRERLTIQDARYVLETAIRAAELPLSKLEQLTLVTADENVKWRYYIPLPKLSSIQSDQS